MGRTLPTDLNVRIFHLPRTVAIDPHRLRPTRLFKARHNLMRLCIPSETLLAKTLPDEFVTIIAMIWNKVHPRSSEVRLPAPSIPLRNPEYDQESEPQNTVGCSNPMLTQVFIQTHLTHSDLDEVGPSKMAKGTDYSIESNPPKRPVSGFRLRNVGEQAQQQYTGLESTQPRAGLMEL